MKSWFFEPSRETKIDLKSRVVRETGGTTITERNLEGSAPHFIQKRSFVQRYSRESQDMRKAKTRSWESCRPVNSILDWGFGSSYRRVRNIVFHCEVLVVLCLFYNSYFFLLNAGIENRSHSTAKPADDGTGRLLGSERSGQSAFIKISHNDPGHLTDRTYHMHNTSQNSYSIHKNMVSL